MGFIEGRKGSREMLRREFGLDVFGSRPSADGSTFITGFDFRYEVERLRRRGNFTAERERMMEGVLRTTVHTQGLNPYTRYMMSILEREEVVRRNRRDQRVSEVDDVRVVSPEGALYALARFVVVTRGGADLLEQYGKIDEIDRIKSVGALPEDPSKVGVVLQEEIGHVFPEGQFVAPEPASRGEFVRALRLQAGLSE